MLLLLGNKNFSRTPKIRSTSTGCYYSKFNDDIQGPQGVNYQVQQLKFKARFKIINEVTRRTVYDRMVLIDSLTLATPLLPEQDCNGEPNAQYCSATVVHYLSQVLQPGLNGIHLMDMLRLHFHHLTLTQIRQIMLDV